MREDTHVTTCLMRPSAALLMLALVAGCATHEPERRAGSGAAVGAVAGAVSDQQSYRRNGRFVGAAIGVLTGAAVGQYMDRQQAALEDALTRELTDRAIRVTRIDEETLKLDVSTEATFDINSASVRADFRQSLASVAGVVGEYDRTVVHLLGHTDDTGSQSYNQRLSESRAEAVSRELARGGVDPERLLPRGRGEDRPVDSNETRSGRSRNRRVEIYLRSVVEGRADEAFRAPA